MTRRILVTGGAGFVGEHCLKRLAATDADIHATTSRSTKRDARVAWHRCDLLDPGACERLVAAVRPTHLLHLAWIATPGEFWASRENVRWLEAGCALIRAFYAEGGARAVGAGTCAEYAWQDEAYYVEDATPLRPASIYGQCKRAMGLAFEAAAAAYGGSAAWGRLFFPYGPGEAAGRLIPSAIRSLLRGEPLDCTHGRQVRDFIYVDDAAAALVALLEADAQGAYNIGSGRASSLRETIGRIADALGQPELVRWGTRAAPASDPPFVVADVSKLTGRVAWQPAVTIESGLERTIAAWRAREPA